MRSSRNARLASAGVLPALVLAATLTAEARPLQRSAGAGRAAASSEDESADEEARASSLRMRGTTIEGERQTPDIFFVLPTGKGGNLGGPYLRDYSYEILDPLVKPWFERDAMLEVPKPDLQASRVDLAELLKAEPPPPPLSPPPASEPEPAPQMIAPPAPLSIPSQARSLPPPASAPAPIEPLPPPRPLPAYEAPPPPRLPEYQARPERAYPPPPAEPPSTYHRRRAYEPPVYDSRDVPILVPPQ